MEPDRTLLADIAVRPIASEDAEAIAAIRVAGWQSAYRGQLDDRLLDGLSAERDRSRWRAHLESPPPGHRGFVAERGGRTVGFATCGPSRDRDEPPGVGELYAIYVLPTMIGTGVGIALLQRVMRTLREDGYREAMLWALEGNLRGHAFYQAAGWRADGGAKRDRMDGFELSEVRYRYRFESTGAP
jgi:GNAT superfamily N-acetyltransferase